MSIASEIARINGNIAAAYTACSEKGAIMPQAENSANLADTIDSISQGGGAHSVEKDVNFYDYDGTLLYSYSAAEAAALSALPPLPSHSGLTAQGWNYTLSQIRANEGGVNVGCSYATTDGATKLYFSAVADTPAMQFSLALKIAAQSEVVINWGDGTSDTVTNTDYLPQRKISSHCFPTMDHDTVFCVRIAGGSFELGNTSQNSMFNDKVVPLQSVEIGTNCTAIRNYAFRYCYSLNTITIPAGVTSIGYNAFQCCYRLRAVTIPVGVNSVGDYMFHYCYNIRMVTIPVGVTNIGNYAFQNCDSLVSITIPDGVTSVGSYTFQNCYGLVSVVLPDSLVSTSTNTFENCTNLKTVRLPAGITSIRENSFANNSLIARIAIPSTVTTIRNMAFYNCQSLMAVDMSGFTDPSAVPTLTSDANSSVFYQMPGKIYVANAEMLAAFSSATNWSSLPSTKFAVKEVSV